MFLRFACIVLVVTSSHAEYSRQDLLDVLRLARRSECGDVSSQCFSTGQCCDGLVCAAIDDYFGQNPESPGSCVKEKDLHGCQSSGDCEGGTGCVAIGRSRESYCVPGADRKHGGSGPLRHAARVVTGSGSLGGLGSPCESSSDCKPFTKDGLSELCCKDVHMGRHGTKRQCDRGDTVNACIPSRG